MNPLSGAGAENMSRPAWTGGDVAVAGLGSMGLGMAGALLRAGANVTGYDPGPEKREGLVALGGTVAASSAGAALGAHIVVSVVVNADQTEALLFGADGVGPVMAEGGVFVSCATMAPERVRRMAARLEAKGRHYLDAPVSGGAQRAAEGNLTVLASGSDQAFTRAQPALDAMAAKVYRLGDMPGQGATFKMVNQLLAGVHVAAASEAIAFAAREGLDLRRVYEVVTASAGNSWMFENRMPHVLEGDYSPRSSVDIFVKDLGIVLDMGRANCFPLPLASAALQLFLMTSAAGMGRDDDASVARLYARIADLDLPGVA
jgi:3-hydroxyisobutyrate dehydrogenase